jgi:hypothetical protein
MGDHANDYNEMCEDEPYWPGADEEPEYEAPLRGPARKSPACRCCGKGGLSWKQSSGKWTLFEGSKIHQCAVNPLNRKA